MHTPWQIENMEHNICVHGKTCDASVRVAYHKYLCLHSQTTPTFEMFTLTTLRVLNHSGMDLCCSNGSSVTLTGQAMAMKERSARWF